MRIASNFGHLMSQFRSASSKQVEGLLTLPNLTIEHLLNTDSEIINASKSRNPFLIAYLAPERLESLIIYITVDPSPFQNARICCKYPLICSELLSIDSPEIQERILDNASLMNRLFKFLEKDSLNSTLAGYFSKVIKSLIKANTCKFLNMIYKNSIDDLFVKHISNTSVVEAIEAFVTSKDHGKPEFRESLHGIIDKIVENIKTVPTSARLLSSIMHTESKNLREIDRYLCSPTLFAQLAELLNHSNTQVVSECAKAMSIILARSHHRRKKWGEPFEFRNIGTIEVYLERCAEILDGFKEKHVGAHRLNILDLINECARQSLPFQTSLSKHELPVIITDLFFSYPWNSMLHCKFDTFIQLAIKCQCKELVDKVFSLDNLPIKIVGACMQDIRKKGYFGHILTISNLIVNWNPKVLLDVPSGLKFITQFLDIENRKNSFQLGREKYSKIQLNLKPVISSVLNPKDTNQIAENDKKSHAKHEKPNTDHAYFDNVYWKCHLYPNLSLDAI